MMMNGSANPGTMVRTLTSKLLQLDGKLGPHQPGPVRIALSARKEGFHVAVSENGGPPKLHRSSLYPLLVVI